MKRDEIFRYVKDQYGTEPEYLWKKIRILQCFDIKIKMVCYNHVSGKEKTGIGRKWKH